MLSQIAEPSLQPHTRFFLSVGARYQILLTELFSALCSAIELYYHLLITDSEDFFFALNIFPHDIY